MRKIKITKILRKEVKEFNRLLFKSSDSNSNFELPIKRLRNLKKSIKGVSHKKYVNEIINNYQDILNADPDTMKLLIVKFEDILRPVNFKKKNKDQKYSFHDQVVYAMRYEDLRKKEFPKYLINSDIRTCVYCNSQYTISFEKKYYGKKKKKVKKIIAKLQLDHFYPKSKYPFLSTSFFNLYPTCANCNLAKGKKESKFELYTNSDRLDTFNFRLDAKSVFEYWVKNDHTKIKVNLESIEGNDTLAKNHNELFQLDAIYENLTDVAEEILIRHKANPSIYRKILNEQFKDIFPDPNTIDRLVLGNYTLKEEIFKRPLAKYTQDIARELKLI